MGTMYKRTGVILFLLWGIYGLKAQQAQSRLDQIELMKQFAGTWTSNLIAKDTATLIVDILPFGTAMECSVKLLQKGKTVNEGRWLWGYDAEYDKYIAAEITNNSPDINLFTYQFTSKNTAEKVELSDVPDPDPTLLISRFEFKSSDLIIQTVTRDNKILNSFTIKRITGER